MRWMMSVAVLAATNVAAAQNYGLPSGIQQGNILHCFNWTANEVKAELQAIAQAGFGSVQISPCQRPDVKPGSPWHDLYRPYDLSFKSSSYCSEEDLRSLCSEASKYGIKIIVDVVANHVDKTAGYHDPWWDSNNRVRWEGGINYGNRYSITHGQLGDYGDVNSEHSDVIAKGKAYVEKLKSLGVKGIRWDAAKHIGLPSEGCGFWSAVTSVSGMWHYGEILDNPGPNAGIIKEYANYMSVTDNQYCNYAARDNGGIPGGFGGAWDVDYGLGNKVVYWAESHDTYSNDDWSCNRSQDVIDRAYAAFACRNGATALYLSRPNTRGFNNIKVGKGSTSFKSKQVAEVNKFRNVMTGRADWFESNGNACSVTRKDGGAVIVMKGSGNVSVKNGGGYCPTGTYKDRVSGSTFTVTSTTISGNVGSSGVAVIYPESISPIDPGTDPDVPGPQSSMYILGNLAGSAGWSTTPGTGVSMTAENGNYVARNVEFVLASGETKCYFNLTDYVGSTWDDLNMSANRYGAATEGEALTIGSAGKVVKYANNVDASGCLSWTVAPGKYDVTFNPSAMTIMLSEPGSSPVTPPDPEIPGDGYYVYFDNTSNWDVKVWAWNDTENCNVNGTWPGDPMTSKDGKLYWKAPEGKVPTMIIFSNNGGQKAGGGDLVFVNKATYRPDGTYSMGGSPVDPPVGPGLTGSMHILGNLAGAAGWSSTPGTGVPMTAENGRFVARNVEFVLASGETKCYFNLTDYVGSTWDDLNMSANRYGAATEGEPLTSGAASKVVKYANNVNASGCLSWTIAPGVYSVEFNPADMTVTVNKTSSVDFIEDNGDIEVRYYNLQGMPVENPGTGIFIKVEGSKVTKVILN